MKQKYTLVIADVEMNVVTDASREAVDKIVGILDRKMRDINLKSRRCTKNQAALLCALEYCSEKLALQERNAELEELAEQDEATIGELESKVAELEEKLAALQNENEIMNGILERAAANTKRLMAKPDPEPAPAPAEEVAEVVEAAQEPETVEEAPAPEAVEAAPAVEEAPAVEAPEAPEVPEAPEQLSVDFEQAAEQEEPVNTKAAQVIGEIAGEEAAPAPKAKAKAKKTKSRSRVGSMFDLLTFNDV